MRRVICWCLCLVLFLSLVPARVFAVEEVSPELQSLHETYINPYYENVVTEADLNRLEDAPMVLTDLDVCTTVSEAGACMRECMVQRQGTITIVYQTNTLDDFSREMMHTIFDAAVVHTGVPEEGDSLLWQYAAWDAEASVSVTGSAYYITFTYAMTYYTTAEQERTLTAQVDSVLSDLELSGKTDYEKICAVYDYICQNVTYDDANLDNDSYKLKYTAYAALIDGTAVCQGYALLLYRFALEMGIDCRFISGIGNGENHGWNIVKIGSQYYNADATWDAGRSEYSYFLVSDANFDDHARSEAYASESFYAAYPMDEVNYDSSTHVGDSGDDSSETEDTTVSGTCGENLSWTLDSNYVLKISGTGEMDDFTSSTLPWKEYTQKITAVVISDGVTSVGDYAFFHCYGIASVELPNSVARIGNSSFFYCRALTNIDLPDDLETIGDNAFGGCVVLAEAVLSEGVISIGDGAFSGCVLTSAVIPEGVTSIGKEVFSGCPLTEVSIPASLTSIGAAAFRDCAPLDFITVDQENPAYCNDEQGALYTKECTSLIVVPTGFVGVFLIPNTVACLQDDSMRNCDELTGVVIPDSVVDVGDRLFFDCAKLDNVVLPNSITEISGAMFGQCESLNGVTIPDTVTSIDFQAFSNCTSLTSVDLPAALVSIGASAFSDCTAMISIVIPDGVTELPESAFTNCSALESVTLPEDLISMGSYAFGYCTSLREIDLPDGLTELDYSVFVGCTSLVYISIPNGVTSIGNHCFSKCSALSEVQLPRTLESIDHHAFYYCTALMEITIPASVTNVGDYCFSYSGLQGVTFRGDVPAFSGNYVFQKMTANAYYPEDNATWTDSVKQDYGGTITWVAYGECSHVTETRNAAEVSCTAEGYTGDVYCTICGELFEQGTAIPASGHSWDDGVVTEEATTAVPGFRIYTCIVCSETKTEEIPVLEHQIPVPDKPYKITNVVSGVHIYWNALDGVSKYGVWRSETGKNGTYKWLGNPTVPHFTDTTTESGKTYCYRVTSVVNGEHSEKSEAIGVIYVSTPDITSRANIAAGVKLGWEEIEGATGYAIYRKSYSGTDAWVRIATVSGNSTFTWTDDSVKNDNGGAYKYTIRALAGADMKTLSGCRNAGRTMVRLSSQYFKSVTKASSTSIKCSWSTSSRVTGYEVRFMVGDTVYKTFTIGNYNTGTKTFTGLKAGQTYTIQVRTYKAVVGVGSFYSDWSTAKTVKL